MASKIIAWPFRALITVYRYCISPFIAGSCRFHPSCSAYADESFQTHNAFKASILTLKRISRCHPWGGSGYDPVPAAIAGDFDDRKGSPERS